MSTRLDNFQRDLNYHFTDQALARRALTHRSANQLHNERLEFLGDSLLGYIVAEFLYDNYPDASEGELSRMRASLVKQDSLVRIAQDLKLGEYLSLGTGELKSGGKQRDSILADAVEAVIGAVYLDGDIQACRPLVHHWCKSILGADAAVPERKDAKTQLQELMQAKGMRLPEYRVAAVSGEAHQQTFHVECHIDSLPAPQTGVGLSKRLAEQEAAAQILQVLGTTK